MKRKEISARIEKISWQCHKDIARRIKPDPWNVIVLDWGSRPVDDVLDSLRSSVTRSIPPGAGRDPLHRVTR